MIRPVCYGSVTNFLLRGVLFWSTCWLGVAQTMGWQPLIIISGSHHYCVLAELHRVNYLIVSKKTSFKQKTGFIKEEL